jgi:NAD(P)-dependent dehydrogenase (short-subunit alcohol dehydrogenase family)
MAAEIHAAHGSMDVVMNIAGISTWGRIEQLEHSDWRRTIEVDLMGPIGVLECFVPPWLQRKFAFPYEFAMCAANKRFDALAEPD